MCPFHEPMKKPMKRGDFFDCHQTRELSDTDDYHRCDHHYTKTTIITEIVGPCEHSSFTPAPVMAGPSAQPMNCKYESDFQLPSSNTVLPPNSPPYPMTSPNLVHPGMHINTFNEAATLRSEEISHQRSQHVGAFSPLGRSQSPTRFFQAPSSNSVYSLFIPPLQTAPRPDCQHFDSSLQCSNFSPSSPPMSAFGPQNRIEFSGLAYPHSFRGSDGKMCFCERRIP